MNEELKKTLETIYRDAAEAQRDDEVEASDARRAGEMEKYFDLSLYIQLADACWALEKWEEAKRWYRHNARIVIEKRAWHAEHSGPDYPIDATVDWDAGILVKSGDLEAGRDHLRKAITHWLNQSGNELVLTGLGLHAAQADLSEFVKYASSVFDARLQLPGGKDRSADQVRKLLHYEPCEVCLLQGKMHEFLECTKKFSEAERLVEGKPGLAFPEPLQAALTAASRGFRTLASLHTRGVEPEPGRIAVKEAFEEAMLNFYRFSGQVDWDLYFMRLNARFADELSAGLPLSPNPFADGWSVKNQQEA